MGVAAGPLPRRRPGFQKRNVHSSVLTKRKYSAFLAESTVISRITWRNAGYLFERAVHVCTRELPHMMYYS